MPRTRPRDSTFQELREDLFTTHLFTFPNSNKATLTGTLTRPAARSENAFPRPASSKKQVEDLDLDLGIDLGIQT